MLWNSLCSIASLVTYAVWPMDFIFIAVFFSQSKRKHILSRSWSILSHLTAEIVYTISLFASLNNREQLREKTTVSKDIPLSLPGQPIKFTTTHGQYEDDPTKMSQVCYLCVMGWMIAEFQESVMVTIERKVEIEGKNEPWELLQILFIS